jgi:hypothetical protein
MVFTTAGGGASQLYPYEIDNSLRFNDGDNPKLAFTPSSQVLAEKKTFTISCWFKRSNLTSYQYLWEMGGNDNANDRFFARLQNTDSLRIMDSTTTFRETNRLFRDPSAWYHLVVAVDTTDGTAGDRIKIYVNGVQETSFATSNNPPLNAEKGFSDNSAHTIGRTGVGDSSSFDGYMADFYAVGGSQLAPTSFGETNDNGVWIPKKYGGSYGTNGFKLEFKQTGTSQNSSGMGADTSGNDNHFAVTNLAATDVTTDTPTNNFATILSIYASSETNPPSSDFSEGNTKFVASTSTHSYGRCSIGVSSGKWYIETKITEGGTGQGSALMSVPVSSTNIFDDAQGAGFQVQLSSSNTQLRKKDKGAETTIFTDFASGNIAQMALDLDNGKMWLGNNGTWYNNNNASTTLDSDNPDITGLTSEMRLFAINSYKSGSDVNTVELNFGNAPFTISSGNTDANGYGNMEFSVPTGFYTVCTKNLAEYG